MAAAQAASSRARHGFVQNSFNSGSNVNADNVCIVGQWAAWPLGDLYV
jgi:hypothetical protein